MKSARIIDKLAYPKEKGPNGRGLCRWCLKEVPEGKRTWCSQACVDEFLIRRDPGFARRQVEKRDKGVCAVCKVDTVQLKRVMRAIHRRTNGYVAVHAEGLAKYFRWRKALEKLYPWAAQTFRHFWEADHILPVVEGGGGCGLDNLRTLCLACHKRATAALAARRAEQRRGLHQVTLFESQVPPEGEKNFASAAPSTSPESDINQR